MFLKFVFFSMLANTAFSQEAPPQAPGGIASFLPIVIVVVIFYFLMIRPQAKQAKEHANMVNALKQNDKIVSISGIFGKIVKVNSTEETVDVEIAENVIVTMKKNSVSDVINKKSKPANDDSGSKKLRSPAKNSKK